MICSEICAGAPVAPFSGARAAGGRSSAAKTNHCRAVGGEEVDVLAQPLRPVSGLTLAPLSSVLGGSFPKAVRAVGGIFGQHHLAVVPALVLHETRVKSEGLPAATDSGAARNGAEQ